MRVATAILALLALASCDTATQRPKAGDSMSGEAVAALTAAGGAFDYRYAYKLPGNHVKAVVEAHAAGCDKLGPARCRILSMRYRVDDASNISATLTFRIDPGVARSFGEEATRVVVTKAGALVENEIAGADATAAARSNLLVSRLREQLANARSAANDPAQQARAQRLETALEVIGEVEAGQGQTFATAPVLMTYISGTPAPGLNGSTDASFKEAGNKLMGSIAGLAQVLAGVGPVLLLLVAGALLLRFLIHGTGGGAPAQAASSDVQAYRNPEDEDAPNRNIIQRWFSPKDDERV
ncbi:hypothetical protein [Sphingomonas sp. LT1P40]|uniref:hypothetical protein n=1 Tax=Alteristakelama amylovorans TaxID=3096166 RepID=UPI002FC60A03